MADEVDHDVYRRSWDAFIDVYGDLLQEHKATVDELEAYKQYCRSMAQRLRIVSKTKIDTDLIEEYDKWQKSQAQLVSR